MENVYFSKKMQVIYTENGFNEHSDQRSVSPDGLQVWFR